MLFYLLDIELIQKNATQFRIWANQILKDYLLKGYAVNQRMDRIENDVHYLKEKVIEFDLQIKTSLPPNEGIFLDGQMFDAYNFVSGIIKSAKKSIVLIDNYIDESVLTMLSKRKQGVDVITYTPKILKQLKLDIDKFNSQYPNITIKQFNKAHDRFLIIDSDTAYHIWYFSKRFRGWNKTCAVQRVPVPYSGMK